MELKEVLIIENDEGMAHRVIEEFIKNNVRITHVTDDKNVEEQITNTHYQMVILDWYLDDTQSSELARLCLEKIRHSYFLPVVIWTDELESFLGEAEDVYRIFPQAMIYPCSKSDVEYDKILDVLKKRHATPPLNFSNDLRQAIILSTEMALYTLAEYSLDDLTLGLKTLIAAEQSPQVDIEHTIRVLFTLIERGILKDKAFITELEKIIRQLSLEIVLSKKTKNIESSIKDLYMFYEPPEDDMIIRTGDLVKVDIATEGEPVLKQAIVMTPACDLANPGKTIFIRLALIEDVLPDEVKNKEKESEWKYTYKEKLFRVCFHQLFVLQNEALHKDKNLKVVMSYNHPYVTLNNGRIRQFQRTMRLSDPYCSDLLHNFVSHAGRIGQPDFSALTLVPE